ncbi:replicative DNA helicase [Dyella caseinilytica]|uniref:DNA 5'-3' helicase n=1 Tax=Dyella caseinilytica TaxID=1849581 RepID=A0ABX7H1E1_9GAMM|nr:replicative DNA helicase [Dyella caseinilytica]QRN55235.1 replicative DNA helicase [Dyella caseinilytica]GGA00307.1 replicative DNA helicase [Dyella caseinilytica]
MNAQVQFDRAPADVQQLRLPPHDVGAEQAVLGALMIDAKALAKISDWLGEGDFYRKDHRLIYRAICALIGRGDPVDPLTLGEWFEANDLADLMGGMDYIYELDRNTPSAANIVAYAEIVAEKSKCRQAINIGTNLMERGYSAQMESQQIFADAQHALSQIQASKLRASLVPVKSAMARMHAELLERYQCGGGLNGIPTPWDAVNDWTNGLESGSLTLVGARPSMGKSAFAIQLALHAASLGHRTALFSVEMSDKQCMARAVACQGRIPYAWVRNPSSDNPDAGLYWGRLERATADILAMPLLLDATPAINRMQLDARCRRAHLQAPLKLVIVDHIHDMKIDPKREARFEYGEIAQTGKTLAKELDCSVIMLCQLNRSLESRANKRPGMPDFRESGELEQKADVMIGLYRDVVYDPSTPFRDVVEILRIKGREMGIGASIMLQSQLDVMRMDNWIGPLPVDDRDSGKPNHRGMR